MRSFLLFILFLQISIFSFSQGLIEIAIEGKSKIIYKTPFKFKTRTGKWALNYQMEYLLEHKENTENPNILTDSLIVKELCEKAKNQNLKEWSKEEFINVYLISEPNYLNFKQVKNSLILSKKQELKKLRKQINQFNFKKNKWRSFPLSFSRPVYTNDKTYALIAFNYGNNGGEIVIYKNLINKWVNAGVINSWSY